MLALAVLALAPSLGTAQYAPKWHVGDWWQTKTWSKSAASGKWVWSLTRYDMLDIRKVGGRDCFVVESRQQAPDGRVADAYVASYVRSGDWLVVRQVIAYMGHDSLCSYTLERPRGLFGPCQAGEPRLPRFPLRLASQDTAFHLVIRDDCVAHLREISQVADPALVERLLADGDNDNGTAVRPTGVVYQVRNEVGGNLQSGLPPRERQIDQSLQLWCTDRPWRLYEELVNYNGPNLTPDVLEKTWLVASGHAQK
jgi:hypothetical protein